MNIIYTCFNINYIKNKIYNKIFNKFKRKRKSLTRN